MGYPALTVRDYGLGCMDTSGSKVADTTGDGRLRCNRVIRSTEDVWDLGCWALLFGDDGLNRGSPPRLPGRDLCESKGQC